MNYACLPLILALSLGSVSNIYAAGYHVCLDPKTGKKYAQDAPCQDAKQLNKYQQVDSQELKKREIEAWKGKRDFERANPGTYRPEEVLTADEYDAYQKEVSATSVL